MTITKCNNYTYLQQIIFIYALKCSRVNEILNEIKNNGKMYYVTAPYDVIYNIHTCIYHRRKRHFEEIVDSYKVINDVIIHFPVIFLKHKFHSFQLQ